MKKNKLYFRGDNEVCLIVSAKVLQSIQLPSNKPGASRLTDNQVPENFFSWPQLDNLFENWPQFDLVTTASPTYLPPRRVHDTTVCYLSASRNPPKFKLQYDDAATGISTPACPSLIRNGSRRGTYISKKVVK